MNRARMRWLVTVLVLSGMGLMGGCASLPVTTSPDFLARISRPSSPHYESYLEYKRGRLTKNELIQRLPHVAMIGDSLTKNFYLSSLSSSFLRAKTKHGNNWFLDTNRSPESIYSVYEQLEEITPLVAIEYSSVGARVDSGFTKSGFLISLIKSHTFSQQVDQILRKDRFPDLLLIWIGHNNLDWAASLDKDERKAPNEHLKKMAEKFRKNYRRQLERLMDRAKNEEKKTAIVVYGLVNFTAFFAARETAEALKAEDPKLYPYLEKDYQIFESMKPEYRKNMIRLALMMNAELQGLVEDLNQKSESWPSVRLEYSAVLATADISAVDMIHSIDAWHPSVRGHNLLAGLAFSALAPCLEFLEIRSK